MKCDEVGNGVGLRLVWYLSLNIYHFYIENNLWRNKHLFLIEKRVFHYGIFFFFKAGRKKKNCWYDTLEIKMAALMESIAFTKILNEGDIIDIADADTEGNILLSSKRKSFVIYKVD